MNNKILEGRKCWQQNVISLIIVMKLPVFYEKGINVFMPVQVTDFKTLCLSFRSAFLLHQFFPRSARENIFSQHILCK